MSSDSEEVTLVRTVSESALFDAVQSLGDANRKTTGLLPTAAWVDYAGRGHLLAAVRTSAPDSPLGYIAYRLPRDEVVIAHLVVGDASRGKGIARTLVDHVSNENAERRGVAAQCRRDWPAHAMWPHLGFVPRGDRPGRSREGSLLTRWWRDHGHPDLMSWRGAPEDQRPVVLDNNVFLDLYAPGDVNAALTRELLLVVLEGRIELLLTPEVHTEIDRKVTEHGRANMHALADTYPRLTVQSAVVTEVFDGLMADITPRPSRPQDVSDVRHVAYAAAAGVNVVVTRDEQALRKLGPVAQARLGVSLVTPQDLVALLDEQENAPSYWPAALLGTGYTAAELTTSHEPLIDRFLNTAAGERKNTFRATLRQLAARRPHANRLLYSDPDGNPIGLVGASPEDGHLQVSLLRLRPGALAASLAAQMVAGLRDLALTAGLAGIIVTEPLLSEVLFAAAERDGYRADPNGRLVCILLDDVLSVADLVPWLRLLRRSSPVLGPAIDPLIAMTVPADGTNATRLAASLEHQLRPLRLLDALLDTWIVPIKPTWSAQLFNAPRQLFGQPDRLGISREHVYYRSPVNAGETAPARILWYASAPEGQLVGCSMLIDVEQGPAEELWRKYRRLGVYARHDVLDAAGKRGKVRCLRVSDTEVFERTLPLRRLKQLASQTSQTLQLVSPRKISCGLFEAIIREVRSDN